MPEDLQWQEKRGVVMVKGKKEVWVTNAVPIVISRCEIIDHEKGIDRKLIKIQFQYCNSERAEEVQELVVSSNL